MVNSMTLGMEKVSNPTMLLENPVDCANTKRVIEQS
jgi:hypothetical protein